VFVSFIDQSKRSSLQNNPLLLWGLYFLIGCAFALKPHWIYLLPLAILLFFSRRALIFFLAGACLPFFQYTLPTSPTLEGTGVFTLQTIQPTQSPFKQSIALKGTLKTFESNGKIYRNIPCSIIQNRAPPSGTKWQIEGRLENKDRYFFKPHKQSHWQVLPDPFSLVHLRYRCKETIRRYFRTTIPDRKTSHFFSSIATGDIDQWLIAMEFRKVGLGHILAISGFHFALIATLLGFFLLALLPPRLAYSALLLFLLAYFIFLGITPSVLRAFIMICLYVMSLLLKRRSSPLNLLGAALLIELILDPLTVQNVGFQLSFLATVGILLYHQHFNQLLEHLLPSRKFSELKQFSRIDQHGYLIATAFRNGLALNLAVHFATLPAMFYTFHCFPLLSFPFNLFFTPLLGISILLLPLGILLPPLGKLNSLYTKWLLEIIANPPEILNFKIFINTLSFPLAVALTTLILAIGLTKRAENSRIAPDYP